GEGSAGWGAGGLWGCSLPPSPLRSPRRSATGSAASGSCSRSRWSAAARSPPRLLPSSSAAWCSSSCSRPPPVGPLAAGVLVSLMDVGLVFVAAALAFLVAALLLARVRVEGLIRLQAAAVGESTVRLLLGGF